MDDDRLNYWVDERESQRAIARLNEWIIIRLTFAEKCVAAS